MQIECKRLVFPFLILLRLPPRHAKEIKDVYEQDNTLR